MEKCTTIGMDLGDKKHAVVGIDDKENIVFRIWIQNDREKLETFFRKYPGVTVGMETGTCCRWISSLAHACGCKVFVGNAYKLRSIFQNSNKNDMRDAEEIAYLVHGGKRHFHPVVLRDDRHQHLVRLLKLRDIVVGQRTKACNAIRGMAKSAGVRLADFDADHFHLKLKSILRELPKDLGELFAPQLKVLALLTETARKYEKLIKAYRDANFKEECRLLETIPEVGLILSTAFVAFSGDIGRFRRARDLGPYYGVTPGRDQSGDKDAQKRITKEGNMFVRKLLVNSAAGIMKENSRDTDLKRFALRVWGGRGKVAKAKAKLALARKLAVTMAAMLRSRTEYNGIISEDAHVEEVLPMSV